MITLKRAAITRVLVLGLFQRRADIEPDARVLNQERLRALKAAHGSEVTIFNSHDPVDYENCRCGASWDGLATRFAV